MAIFSGRSREPNVAFRFVRHPGTKAQPFIRPSLKTGLKILGKVIKKAMVGLKPSSTVAEVIAALDPAVHATAGAVMTLMIQKAPVDTGRLKDSFNVQKAGVLRYSIGTNVRYARHVEYGTKPHIIRPVNARVLAFYWPKVAK